MPQKMIELECKICGTKFNRLLSEYNRNLKRRNNNIFCSKSCSSKNRSKLREEHYKKSAERLKNFNAKNGYSLHKADEYSSFRIFMKNIRSRCIETDKCYDIDLQYLKNLWESQNGICPYTGWQLIKKESTGSKICLTPNRASLDRIDSSKGYIKGNVIFVSWMWQLAKNIYSEEDVINFCKSVTENINKKCMPE